MNEQSTGLIDMLRHRYGIEVRSAVAMVGGYDIWADTRRLDTDQGPVVVRADRGVSVETAEWLGGVVSRAASAGVPCQAPILALDGTSAVVVDDATVTVRAFAQGVKLDRDDPAQVADAGIALGQLHQALRDVTTDRPTPSPWAACFWPGHLDPPGLRDPSLDEWNEAFAGGALANFSRGVVHGDFYADNLLCAEGQIVAVIDWAESRLDIQSRELAWATWEFGHDETCQRLDIDRARTFLHGYNDATGPWEDGLEETLIPLMRLELRRNARYSLTEPTDLEYNTNLQHAFARLRAQSAVPLIEGPA